jgi:RNA 3'-terminal phosphate cyclase (ATP)
VAQAVLPALVFSGETFELEIEGGTHAMNAPPFEFLDRAWLPLLRRMGARVEATLSRVGFYPAGGGAIRVRVEPPGGPQPLALEELGARRSQEARAIYANLPRHVAERELDRVEKRLGWGRESLRVEVRREALGPGNALLLVIEHEHVTEVFSGFGAVGVTAEHVAERACQEAKTWLAAQVPVGTFLADQLVLPMALGAGGEFRTLPLSRHTRTNLDVLSLFLGPVAEGESLEGRAARVRVKGRARSA